MGFKGIKIISACFRDGLTFFCHFQTYLLIFAAVGVWSFPWLMVVSKGREFFPFRVNPFSDGRQKKVLIVCKVYHITLKIHVPSCLTLLSMSDQQQKEEGR